MSVSRIERFLRESGMTATAFGRRVCGDPNLVPDMRRGRVPGARIASRIEAVIGGGR